jgi:SAM-dependent methyltransferase
MATLAGTVSGHPAMGHDDAIVRMRLDPRMADTVRDNYIGADVLEAATRFAGSAEFAEVAARVGGLAGKTVVDIGAGNGIASYAFATAGADLVYAIEPDDSPIVGRQAMRTIVGGLPIKLLAGVGERIPLPDGCAHVVYVRATLHHVQDLDRFAAEAARVLRVGGTFVACREHVAENERELRKFLADHPLHRLAGGEHAYPVGTYSGAIRRAGLRIDTTLGPWDSVVNAFPTVRSDDELRELVRTRLSRRLGPLRRMAFAVRSLEPLLALWVKRPVPGRLYSFIATKP